MKTKFLFVLAFCMIAITGCYTATIETGLPASNIKIEENWAMCFAAGLIPPKTVETAAKCPHGVAKVMTQLSFPNQLVGALTLGIYTPMTIQVTCARASETSRVDLKDAFVVSRDAPSKEFQNVFVMAAERAAKSDNEIFVVIEDQKQNKVAGKNK